MTRSVNVWFAADKLALRYVCLPVLLVNPVCIVSPMLHTHLVSIQPLSKGKRVNPKTLNKASTLEYRPALYKIQAYFHTVFQSSLAQCGPPTTKFSPNVHILSSTAYSKQPTSHFHTQTTKFIPNAQIHSSTAYLKQSTSNSTPKLQNSAQMLKFFHPRPTQNNPLPISTPKLQNSATILQFFHPLPTQNSLRPLACWDLGSNPTGGMDVCLL